MQQSAPVLIAGAGLAGLACALYLQRSGMDVQVFEAADRPGGRVATDSLGGFLLNRGFQVLLEAYPEARGLLDYGSLELQRFFNGALLRHGGRFHRFADPWREPGSALAGLLGPGSFADRLRLSSLRSHVQEGSLEDLFERPEQSSLEYLSRRGFSQEFVYTFLRPFFGGIFFDASLATSSRMLEFVFRMFAQGSTSVPGGGMQQIPLQLEQRLGSESLRLNAPVQRVAPGEIELASGELVKGSAVVVATDLPAAARLLPAAVRPRAMRSVTTLYFDCPAAPLDDPLLILNGEQQGPLNDAVVISNVAPSYAPAGRALLSATVLGDPPQSDGELAKAALRQLGEWFGGQAQDFLLLRVYRIREALPEQAPPALSPPQRSQRIERGLYVCGDHLDNASINGALASGRRCAEALLVELGAAGAADEKMPRQD